VSESPSEGGQVITEQSSGTIRDLAIGAAIGYCASRAMDLATDWCFEHQSEASRRREEEVAPGGTLVLAGRWLAGTLGRDVTDEEAERIGWVIHRVLGVVYGTAAAALARAGVSPMRAGIATGAAAFVLVDEGFMSAFVTPPPWAYLVESHVRGIVGHLAYGGAVGVMLAVARRLVAVRA
jgi:hypothetical protein